MTRFVAAFSILVLALLCSIYVPVKNGSSRFRQWMARRRLQRMVEARRASFETRLFAKNRAAQLKRRGA